MILKEYDKIGTEIDELIEKNRKNEKLDLEKWVMV
jgi:hypothetical protein